MVMAIDTFWFFGYATKAGRLSCCKMLRDWSQGNVVMHKDDKSEEFGWLPDREYKLSEAIILSIILLALTVLVGSVS